MPDRAPHVFWAAAQIRPTTGPMTLADDVVGDLIAYGPEHVVWTACTGDRADQWGRLRAGMPVDVHAVPVSFQGRVIAVVEQHTSGSGCRRRAPWIRVPGEGRRASPASASS